MTKVQTILQTTKCTDLLSGKKIIEIDAQSSIAEGCQVLVQNGISSAPVYNGESGEYVGMLDYRDIVDYVLTVFHKKPLEPISEDEVIGITDIVQRASSGENIASEAIVDLSRKNPFYSVMAHSSLQVVIDIFSSNLGIHRINVVNNSGRVEGLVSKTDVIRFLLANIEMFGNAGKASLKDAGLALTPLVTVSVDSSVLDALEKMSRYGISSIPVLDHNNRLMGNISMADVRFVFQHNRFNRLWMNCSHFVSLTLSQKGLENSGQDSFPVFDVQDTTSISKVMAKLLATKTHRIWVVDQNSCLEGVVSMTDIIRYLCKANINK